MKVSDNGGGGERECLASKATMTVYAVSSSMTGKASHFRSSPVARL